MRSASLVPDSSLSNPVLITHYAALGDMSLLFRYQENPSGDWHMFFNRYDFVSDTLHWQISTNLGSELVEITSFEYED